jgi:serine protease Do
MNTTQFLFLPSITAALLLAPPRTIALEGAAVPKPSANLELARQLNQAFVQVAEEVSPVVVVITVIQKPAALRLGLEDGADGQDPMDRLPPEFRRYFQQAPREKETGQGSGIIIREDGYILTNRHVVEDAEKIEVRLKDGRTFKATVRGVDSPSDVAVIKIDAKNLPVARLADSAKTRVGEFAIAIGAPFALDYSVTFGHVSAKDRSNVMTDDPEEATLMDQSFIQTDANINPGNSGGPLVNIDGEVIGVNTLIRGLHTGIGFAIPSNLAREVADQLITAGKFSRPWLGVKIVALRDYTGFRDLVPGVPDGVVIREIYLDSPAAKSDLKPADVITAIDGKSVNTAQQLKDEIRVKKIGQDMTLSVVRQVKDEGQHLKIVVKPGEWVEQPPAMVTMDTPPAEESTNNGLGLRVDLPRRRRGGAPPGVVVTRVERGKLADRCGIQEGDLITSISGQAVTNPRQFNDLVPKLDFKKGVIVNFIRQGAAGFEVLKDGGD